MTKRLARIQGGWDRQNEIESMLREVLHSRHYGRRTEQTYCQWVKRCLSAQAVKEIGLVWDS